MTRAAALGVEARTEALAHAFALLECLLARLERRQLRRREARDRIARADRAGARSGIDGRSCRLRTCA
jgi:hypothetical protein